MSGQVVNREDVKLSRTDWGSLVNLFDGKVLDTSSAFSFGLISYKSPHHSGRHSDNELIYILRGKGVARIGSGLVTFKPGTLLIVAKGTDHGIEEVHGPSVHGVVVHFL
jgi:quercetin dioxygenase-like cupin family protein